jgi:DHA1 family bicyclomycin/chloramphenicol resistance-like MFS transporter
MAYRPLHPDSPWLLALLAALVALGPLSVDMYLPAMPYMKEALGADVAGMHLTLSSYLLGFALFHLACGPLADRYGRKPILLGGIVLFVLSCIGCSQSSTIEELLVFRFFQGVGSCVGPTLARAITQDIFGPTRAARALSLIAMIMAPGPAVAPGLGGLMLLVLPWGSIFVFLAAYGLVTLLLVNQRLDESLPQRQSLHPAAIARNYWELICDPYFLLVITISGLIFLTTVMGYLSGSALSERLSSTLLSEQILFGGTVSAFVSVILMLAATYQLPTSVVALVLPTVLYSIGMGLLAIMLGFMVRRQHRRYGT